MTKVLIVGYGSVGNRHLENFLRFKDIQLTVYTKRNDVQLLKKNQTSGLSLRKLAYIFQPQLNWQTQDWIYF